MLLSLSQSGNHWESLRGQDPCSEMRKKSKLHVHLKLLVSHDH